MRATWSRKDSPNDLDWNGAAFCVHFPLFWVRKSLSAGITFHAYLDSNFHEHASSWLLSKAKTCVSCGNLQRISLVFWRHRPPKHLENLCTHLIQGVQQCGFVTINPSAAICCQGLVYMRAGVNPSCCGALAYDSFHHICCDGKLHRQSPENAVQCCSQETFDARQASCESGQVTTKARKSAASDQILNRISSTWCYCKSLLAIWTEGHRALQGGALRPENFVAWDTPTVWGTCTRFQSKTWTAQNTKQTHERSLCRSFVCRRRPICEKIRCPHEL